MSWDTAKLDELGSVSRGRSRHRPRNDVSLYGGEYPFIQTADIASANYKIEGYSQTYNEKGLAQSKLWSQETLCITIAGENTAKTAVLSFPACFPDSIVGFIPDREKANLRFIKHTLDLMKSRFRAVSMGATQDNLSLKKILSFDLPIPDLSTQECIAGVLSAYDDLIEINRRRITLLEEASRLTFREWFVHFRFPGHETAKFVDGLPEGWEEKKVKNLGAIVTGKTPSKKNSSNFNGNIPFIKTPDMHGNAFIVKTGETITEEGARTQPNKTLPPRSVLVSCIGTVGAVSINAREAQFNQQINAVIPNEETNYIFVYFLMKGIKPKLEGFGSGATMANVNKSKFESISILMPDKEIMDEFYNHTYTSFEQLFTLSRLNIELVKARDLLLPRLMDGRIEV